MWLTCVLSRSAALQSWDAVSALKPVIQACKAHGSLVIGQLTNGGRQTSQDINEEPYSSSSEQCPPMGGSASRVISSNCLAPATAC